MTAEINQPDYQRGIFSERLRVVSIIAELLNETGEQVSLARSEDTRKNLLDQLALMHKLNLRIAESDYESDPEKWEL